MSSKDTNNNQAYEEAMDDVHTRFILNLPDEELRSAPRIFFQLEQAWWFYDDFICDAAEKEEKEKGGKRKKKGKKGEEETASSLPRFKHVKPFSYAMFQFSPLLLPMLPQFEDMYEEFNVYKRSISTYGTILLNEDATKVALCRVYKGKAWTLPGGKVNQNESGKSAAARETYEETGFDPECERGLCCEWKERRERGESVKELLSSNKSSEDVDAPSDEEETEDQSTNLLLPWQPLQDADKLVYTEHDTKKRRTCYVCRGVPESFPFMPVARKEVSEIQWHSLRELPKTTYAVLPFVAQLRKWIKRDNRKRGIGETASRGRGGGGGKDCSRAGSRGRNAANNNNAITPTAILAKKGGGRGKNNHSRGKTRQEDEEKDEEDDVGLTPFFSDEGNAPWEEQQQDKKEGTTGLGNQDTSSLSSPTTPSSNKKEKNKSKQQQTKSSSRPNSRSGSRGKSGSRPNSRSRQKQQQPLGEDDPLVLSALASPGESDRWTEEDMFATNELLLGRKITYDGNPHDFAERGFDVLGEDGEGRRVDPHAFRVVGGTFMNSNVVGGGVSQLSAPPSKGALQPLFVRVDTSTANAAAGLDGGGGDGGFSALTPFFSDNGKAPWEEDGKNAMAVSQAPPPVRSAVRQSNSKGLALLNRLRQGTPANGEEEEEWREDADGGVANVEHPPQQPEAPSSNNKQGTTTKTKKGKKKKKGNTSTTNGDTEDFADWFMTDREITAKSQQEKLSILPPSPMEEPGATMPGVAQPTMSNDASNEHWAWMTQWVQRLPEVPPTKEFGDFRLDVTAVMNAMAV